MVAESRSLNEKFVIEFWLSLDRLDGEYLLGTGDNTLVIMAISHD